MFKIQIKEVYNIANLTFFMKINYGYNIIWIIQDCKPTSNRLLPQIKYTLFNLWFTYLYGF